MTDLSIAKSLEEQVKKLPEPKELVLFPDADHFWSEEEAAMAEKVGRIFWKKF